MDEKQLDQMDRKVCMMDRILRGTDTAPGHGARLHNAEKRLDRIEKNEQDMKDWNKDLRRLYIFVAVSLLGTAGALIAAFQ